MTQYLTNLSLKPHHIRHEQAKVWAVQMASTYPSVSLLLSSVNEARVIAEFIVRKRRGEF